MVYHFKYFIDAISLHLVALSNFNRLEILDLHDNSFTGSISPYIGVLSSLKAISLAYNQLNDTVFSSFSEKAIGEGWGKTNQAKMNSLQGSSTLSASKQLGIDVEDFEIAEAKKQRNNGLISKIWAEKRVNKEGFISVFKRIWRTESGINFKEIQPNMWMFEFSLEADKMKVLEGRPWSFDRFLLTLLDFDGSIPSSQWEFTTSPFWIQIHDLPLICMTKVIGSKIGHSMGVLELVDIAGEGVEWGSMIRI